MLKFYFRQKERLGEENMSTFKQNSYGKNEMLQLYSESEIICPFSFSKF